jgi:ABC-type glycerol-3-phosphate transport system substrate-binding protein
LKVRELSNALINTRAVGAQTGAYLRMRRKKNWRVLWGLIAVFTLFLFACGKEESNETQTPLPKKENNENLLLAKESVFQVQELGIDLQETMENYEVHAYIAKIDYFDGLVRMLVNYNAYYTGAEGGGDSGLRPLDTTRASVDNEEPAPAIEMNINYYKLLTCDANGQNIQLVELTRDVPDLGESSWVSGFTFTRSGDVLILRSTSLGADEDNIYRELTTMICYSAKDGSILWEKEIEGVDPTSQEEYYYLSSFETFDDGQIYIEYGGSKRFLFFYDENGDFSEKLELEADMFENLLSYFIQKDGTILLLRSNNDWTKTHVATYDIHTKALSEAIELPFQTTNYSIYLAPTQLDASFMLSDSTGIYTYKVGEDAPVQLMNYINSDFPGNNLLQFTFLDEHTFVGCYNDQGYNQQTVAFFRYVAPEDIPDKSVLVLGLHGYYGRIAAIVREFNTTNEEYRVVVRDYSQYQTNEDYTAGYTQLNNDILAGKIPDIFLLNSNMTGITAQNYMNQDLFENLRPFYEKDESFQGKEVIENILNVISGGEDWYIFAPEFSVETVIGKKSLVGNAQDWSIDTFLSMYESLEEGQQMFAELTKGGFINYAMRFLGNEFVDPKTGKCDFTSEEFRKLLTFAATLPDTIDYEEFDESYYMDYQTQYINENTLLMITYLYSASGMKYTLGEFGEEIEFLGFPGKEGGVSRLIYDEGLAMSSKSAYQDGAWAFMKLIVSDKILEEYNYGYFSIRRDIFDKQFKEAMSRPYYMENGEKIEYDDKKYINDEEIILPPLTQAQVDQFTSYVLSVTNLDYDNEKVLNIITEESEAFFAGQKTVEEVTGIIQSRVQVYVNENM